jgi:hypothetical protein|tara:strand:- start:14960 stop:15313 length:354 start_codon:yes stop_codon:yes gene_type:complete
MDDIKTPTSVLDTLNESRPALYRYHRESVLIDHTSDKYLQNRLIENIAINMTRVDDTYEINHGLSDEDHRILLKIVAKELPDVGRKRGAILRYIASFKKEPEPEIGSQLLRHLNRIP